MRKQKIAITLDEQYVGELDKLVAKHVFGSQSQAIQQAVCEKLLHLKKTRLAEECARLEPKSERALADEGLDEDTKEWPQY